MNGQVIIRDAATGDLKDLHRLVGQLGYPDLSLDELAMHVKSYQAPDYRLLVMEVEGRVDGFAALHWYQTFHLSGLTGRIVSFCVADEIRSKGYGAQLLAFSEEYLFGNGCSKIELTSNLRRDRAHAFYQRHGYREVSRHFIKKRHS